jgi:hypothetical protein
VSTVFGGDSRGIVFYPAASALAPDCRPLNVAHYRQIEITYVYPSARYIKYNLQLAVYAAALTPILFT